MLLINAFYRFYTTFYSTTWNRVVICLEQPSCYKQNCSLVLTHLSEPRLTILRMLLPHTRHRQVAPLIHYRPTSIACHTEGWSECRQTALAGRVCLRSSTPGSACPQEDTFFGPYCISNIAIRVICHWLYLLKLHYILIHVWQASFMTFKMACWLALFGPLVLCLSNASWGPFVIRSQDILRHNCIFNCCTYVTLSHITPTKCRAINPISLTRSAVNIAVIKIDI